MGVRIILQNAKAQLEAQKQKVYQDAYSSKKEELKPQLDAYVVEKKKDYDDAVVRLKTAFDEAVSAKNKEVEALAASYASIKQSTIDNSIKELDEMIATAED